MSTVDHSPVRSLPPLVDGQRLDQPTFHERYEAMPPGTRAELIGGVVSMASPVSIDQVDKNDGVTIWLGHYERFTPGVRVHANVSTILDGANEVQPDAMLRILPEFGGQTRPFGKYLGGSPELIVEVGVSTRSTDLSKKLREYERLEVLEYVVATSNPDAIHWHVRQGDRFVIVPPDADGVYRSTIFPGLWLDPNALLSRDLNGLIATLDRGLASDEHAVFVERLKDAGSPKTNGI